MYRVMITISQEEHDMDREWFVREILSGERPVYSESGRKLTLDEVAALPREVVAQWAEEILGPDWDHVYAAGRPGDEHWGATGAAEDGWTFATREEAQAYIDECWADHDCRSIDIV